VPTATTTPQGFVPGDDGTVAHRDAAGLPLALGAAVLMQVAAAHAGRLHLDDDIVSVRRGIGEWHQFQLAFAVKHHATHRFLRCYCSWADIGREIRIGKVRTSRGLAALMTRSSIGPTEIRCVTWHTRIAAGFW
jgi:hypothetical protein